MCLKSLIFLLGTLSIVNARGSVIRGFSRIRSGTLSNRMISSPTSKFYLLPVISVRPGYHRINYTGAHVSSEINATNVIDFYNPEPEEIKFLTKAKGTPLHEGETLQTSSKWSRFASISTENRTIIVNDREKKAYEIITGLLENISYLCDRLEMMNNSINMNRTAIQQLEETFCGFKTVGKEIWLEIRASDIILLKDRLNSTNSSLLDDRMRVDWLENESLDEIALLMGRYETDGEKDFKLHVSLCNVTESEPDCPGYIFFYSFIEEDRTEYDEFHTMTDRHGNEEMVFETDKSHDLLHVVLPKEDPGHRFDMPLPKTKTSLSDDILDILLSVVSIAVLIWYLYYCLIRPIVNIINR